jgi:dTDP-glucose 4,6-dehydratase
MLKSVIVTGGYGFIGSNLVRHLIDQGIDVLNLDDMRTGADTGNLQDIEDDSNYSFKKVNLADPIALKAAVGNFVPDIIFHLAAESHVDRSIEGPRPFIESNIIGTFNLLELVRLENINCRFVLVSTDEVFGSLELGSAEKFSENSRYKPSSPYSASKAAADHLAKAWFETYGLDVIVTNCSNNYGPRQHSEKLVPMVIKNAISGKSIPVYGDGLNVRDWLFVDDHVSALIEIARNGVSGNSYLIGGNNELPNIELIKLIFEILKREPRYLNHEFESLLKYVEDRAGHDRRYAIDSSKLMTELNWEPSCCIEEGIRQTILWYLKLWGEAR